MQVVVKKPHIRMEGEIFPELIQCLREHCEGVDVIENEDEHLLEITKSDWYRRIRNQISPGENLRIYRKLHGLSQEQVGKKMGDFNRRHISEMEHGRRPISTVVAKKLAELFDVSMEKFYN